MRRLSSAGFRVLQPLLLVYRWGVYLRRKIVKGMLPDLPVISVGNIAFGGSGKTPVSIFLAQHFENMGYNVAVGIRGYKGKLKTQRAYPPGQGINPEEAGDEAAVLRENLPGAWIFVGKRREALASMAKEKGAELLILDDAFQYIKLRKIEVVLHSENTPSFYLRECNRALNYAHIVLYPEGERTSHPYTYSLYPENIPQKRVFAFCGIARPENFLKIFPNLGGYIIYPDHHLYTPKDLEDIYRKSGGLPIYTTEKDMVKVRGLDNFRGGIFPVKWKARVSRKALGEIERLLKSWPLVLK